MVLRMSGFRAWLWLASVVVLGGTAAAEPAADKAIAAANYEPRPALWLLADEDTRIYLFGTVHILPANFRWVSPAVERTIAEADELVVETHEEPGKEFGEEELALLLLDTPIPLAQRVPEASRPALANAIEKAGIPRDFFDDLRTWAAAMFLGVAVMLKDYGIEDVDDAPGVEDLLEARFRQAGKPILSVEEASDVLRSLNGIPEEKQVELLVKGLEEIGREDANLAEDDHNWATGKVEALAIVEGEEFPAALYDALLTKRNTTWTEWLARRLEKPGTVMFAVGAGHLAGRDSVQEMLAKRGLKVVRID